MKCPECKGTGYVYVWDGWSVCHVCDGEGYLTNIEYMHTCSPEELAIFICNNLLQEENGTLQNRFFKALYSQYPVEPMNAYHEVIRWLKEKHEEAK